LEEQRVEKPRGRAGSELTFPNILHRRLNPGQIVENRFVHTLRSIPITLRYTIENAPI